MTCYVLIGPNDQIYNVYQTLEGLKADNPNMKEFEHVPALAIWNCLGDFYGWRIEFWTLKP